MTTGTQRSAQVVLDSTQPTLSPLNLCMSWTQLMLNYMQVEVSMRRVVIYLILCLSCCVCLRVYALDLDLHVYA